MFFWKGTQFLSSPLAVSETYRIRHELTVEISFIRRVLKNVIKCAFDKLNFLDKFKIHNSQRKSDSFYDITESS